MYAENAEKKKIYINTSMINIKQCKYCGTFTELIECKRNNKVYKWNVCKRCRHNKVSQYMKKDWKKGNRSYIKLLKHGIKTRFRHNHIPYNKGLTKAESESLLKASNSLLNSAKKPTTSWITNVSKDDPRYKRFIAANKNKKYNYNSEIQRNLIIGQRKRFLNTPDCLRFTSSIESIVEHKLIEHNIYYIKHMWVNNIKHVYPCDFYITKHNIIIECDGDYWHKYPYGNEIDHVRNKELIDAGYTIIRFWEHEIRASDFKLDNKVLKQYKNNKLNYSNDRFINGLV
jgi:very-short-patch-repair endonuclease